jgi:pseudouridine kinase
VDPVLSSIICLGAAAVDRKYRAVRMLEPDTSNPVTSTLAFGGVARNVAENLARLGVPAALASLVGEDENGRAILADAERLGIDTTLTQRDAGARTAEYVAVLQPDGRLAFGLADMAIFDAFGSAFLDRVRPALVAADWVFADCNLPAEVIERLVRHRRAAPFRLAVDAVSRAKAARLPRDLAGIDLLFLNEAEAEVLTDEPSPAEAARRLRRTGADAVVLTRGSAGALICTRDGEIAVPARAATVVDVTGAGDAFIAGTLAALRRASTLAEAVAFGTALAAMTVESAGSVSAALSPKLLDDAMAVAAGRSR